MGKQQKKGYWNEQTCREEAMKYKTKKEFRNCSKSAYATACRNGWLQTYDWFKEIRKTKGYWNKETCREEAKKYKTITEFARAKGSAYQIALNNGWLESYEWLINRKLFTETGRWYNLYIYKWEDLNSIYVGITLDPKKRDFNHHQEGCTVFNFSKENNVCIPQMEIVESHLTTKQATEKEGWYIEQYKQEGFNVINKAKAGSIGGLGAGIWNKTACEREAKKYKIKSEFKKANSSAYGAARKNGWLKKYDWFVKPEPHIKYTYEVCFNAAKRYVTKNEFQENCPSEYDAACKRGWLPDYNWLTTKREVYNYWNEETCREEAKKYKSRGEFKKGQSYAYTLARENGWLDSYDWFEESKTGKKWNRETCREEAKKYNNRSDFCNTSVGAYEVALANNWLDDYDWFENRRERYNYWNEQTCREEAMKYNSRSEFEQGSSGAYDVARKNKWLDSYDWFIQYSKPNGYWTYENCHKEAIKYRTRGEFAKGSKTAYAMAWKQGWLTEWFEPTRKPKGYWTYDTCKEEASKYKSRREFSQHSSAAYHHAKEERWLDEFFPYKGKGNS